MRVAIRNDFDADLVQISVPIINGRISTAGTCDDQVLRAMLVSTLKDRNDFGGTPARRGRLNYLMKGRHGTPFEHNSMTFRVSAPIFVFREWHRHRIGISINEQSGRYTEFEPVFYCPPKHRALVQVGKQGDYKYVPGTAKQYAALKKSIRSQAQEQWNEYQGRLSNGIALEVARMSLGVNVYSTMYWTCNARSLMAFLSLRTKEDAFWIEDSHQSDAEPGPFYFKNPGGAMFPSNPMWEIDQCARMLEEAFSRHFPLTHALFVEHGRVAP